MPKIQAEAKIRITNATKQLLSESGDFTMRDVAKRSDIALGTIYNYYPSKAELIIDIVAKMWDRCFDEMRSIKAEDFYACVEQVYRILRHYLEGFTNNLMWQLSNLNARGKQLSESFNTRYINICKTLLVDILKEHMDRFDSVIINKITLDELAQFVLRHLLSMATSKIDDYNKFDYFIRKLLS